MVAGLGVPIFRVFTVFKLVLQRDHNISFHGDLQIRNKLTHNFQQNPHFSGQF